MFYILHQFLQVLKIFFSRHPFEILFTSHPFEILFRSHPFEILFTSSPLFVLPPPAFEALSSSPMFPIRDEDGGYVVELVIYSVVVAWLAWGSNFNAPTFLMSSINLRISSGTSNWLPAVMRVSSCPLFTVVSNCESIKLGRLITSL